MGKKTSYLYLNKRHKDLKYFQPPQQQKVKSRDVSKEEMVTLGNSFGKELLLYFSEKHPTDQNAGWFKSNVIKSDTLSLSHTYKSIQQEYTKQVNPISNILCIIHKIGKSNKDEIRGHNFKKNLKTLLYCAICSSVLLFWGFFRVIYKEPFSGKPVWNLGKREFKRHEGLQNKVPHGVVFTQTLCLTDSSYQGKAIQLVARWFTSHFHIF